MLCFSTLASERTEITHPHGFVDWLMNVMWKYHNPLNKPLHRFGQMLACVKVVGGAYFRGFYGTLYNPLIYKYNLMSYETLFTKKLITIFLTS